MNNHKFPYIGYDYSYYNRHMRNAYHKLELDEQNSKGKDDEGMCVKCAFIIILFVTSALLLSTVL